ncbi:MAG TPA: hypothetical protein VJ720_01380, partial [Chitinophaga sp.]|nr:hypothetical protein [Chitinophaga sp.]
IPIKGKPSGSGKEGLGLRPSISPEALKQDEAMTEKYTTGPDQLAPGIHVRHPNRDTAKKASQQQENKREAPADKAVEETFAGERPAIRTEEISQRLNKTLFAELASVSTDLCLSIYLPTHASGKEVNEKQDAILFKSMLQKAQKILEGKQTDTSTIQQLLQPGYELLRDDGFWRQQQQGLACFITKDTFRFLRVPVTVNEHIYCNNHFMLTPLLPVLTKDEQFYLLVFSKHHAQLYLADAFGIQPVEVEGMPDGIADVVHFEEKGNQMLFRTGSSGAGEGANYHGMNSNPDHKTDIALYLEEVDKTVWKEVLYDKHIPLMLASVDYLQPIYRKVSRYQYISDEALTGNYEHENMQEIYRQAKEKMQPYFDQRLLQAIEKYNNSSATALTASIPDDVIRAASYGQVDNLFVEKDGTLWGTFDVTTDQLDIHDEEQPGDECLLNNVIVQTILHNGNVFLVEKERMPAESQMAASLRYA